MAARARSASTEGPADASRANSAAQRPRVLRTSASSEQTLRVTRHGVLVLARRRLAEPLDDALSELLGAFVLVGLRDVGVSAARVAAVVDLARVLGRFAEACFAASSFRCASCCFRCAFSASPCLSASAACSASRAACSSVSSDGSGSEPFSAILRARSASLLLFAVLLQVVARLLGGALLHLRELVLGPLHLGLELPLRVVERLVGASMLRSSHTR